MRAISRYLVMLTVLYGPLLVKGQKVPVKYIQEGLHSNLALKEKNVGLQKSLLALKVAKSLFLPTTWLEGQYTLSQGGRTLDIPAGDLINPIYKTLNQLTGSNNFPTVKNVSESFLPNDFYALRVKTTLPIINSDLKYNRRISEQATMLQKNEVEIYKRELVRDIKVAYYQYLQSIQAIDIYHNALVVVTQNLRVNQSLLQNGKGLPAYVAKAESELEKVQSELDNARNDSRNAEAYFNFLLNRPLEDSIEFSPETAPLSTPKFTDLDTPDRREELNSLAILSKIDSLSYRMDKAYRSPKLNAFLDLGAQNFQFRVDNKSFFYLTGLQLDIPIFSGKRNLYKIDQAALDARTVSLQRQDTRNQLQLAILVSRNAVVNAWNTYESALKQESSAGKYFRLVNLGYAQGVNSFLEFLDARTTYTNARLLSNIDHYKVLIALADYERQTSSYQFN